MARTEQEIQALRDEVDGVTWWWHPIDLGDGIVTPGHKHHGDHAALDRELETLHLPALEGRSVLDIGAADGFYSFAAERRGAARVVSLDHHLWDHEELGGGKGYEVAHRALASRAERRHEDFMTTDLDALGAFDVVLFLGVLYHLDNPVEAMRRLRRLTGGVAVIETEAVELRGITDRPVAEFFPGAELNDDATNWWSPNMAALKGLCTAGGFSRVEVIQGGSPMRATALGAHRYRAIVHAFI